MFRVLQGKLYQLKSPEKTTPASLLRKRHACLAFLVVAFGDVVPEDLLQPLFLCIPRSILLEHTPISLCASSADSSAANLPAECRVLMRRYIVTERQIPRGRPT